MEEDRRVRAISPGDQLQQLKRRMVQTLILVAQNQEMHHYHNVPTAAFFTVELVVYTVNVSISEVLKSCHEKHRCIRVDWKEIVYSFPPTAHCSLRLQERKGEKVRPQKNDRKTEFLPPSRLLSFQLVCVMKCTRSGNVEAKSREAKSWG